MGRFFFVQHFPMYMAMMFASTGRRDDTSANTTRFTSTSSEMAQHDSGSAGVEDLPQDVTRHGNVNKNKKNR